MHHQLIYRSHYRPSESGVSATVRDIVVTSEQKNGHDGITGFLLFDKTHFLQILEGAGADVDRTFSRISQDCRHDTVTVLSRRTVSDRAFVDWHMGGAVRSPDMEAIFQRHGVDQNLGDVSLLAEQWVALFLDVAAWEAERSQTRGLSGR